MYNDCPISDSSFDEIHFNKLTINNLQAWLRICIIVHKLAKTKACSQSVCGDGSKPYTSDNDFYKLQDCLAEYSKEKNSKPDQPSWIDPWDYFFTTGRGLCMGCSTGK
ncbi:hypothetical protein D3C81_1735800 [compost metagenome]